MNEKIFKAYDIRGIYPGEINEKDAYKIAASFCDFLRPETVAVGSDVRLSSPALKKAAVRAVLDKKIKVIDVGEISTDMLYFAVANYGYSSGFTITASHNPREYNGLKMVRENSRPISSDTGLWEIRDSALKMENPDLETGKENEDRNLLEKKDIREDYIAKIKTFADFSSFKKFKIVANPNFGVAGKNLEKLLSGADVEVIKINWEPDGNFPKGRPDPLIPENRKEISERVVEEKADFGVAWDADADRCFFFTEKGEFIEGYFITALLARIFLEKNPGEKIVHDPRLVWAVRDAAKENGGEAVVSKSGHSFIKERMKKEDAVFGGEMSAHYYFRDYWFCDNGLIPLVMMLEFLSKSGKTLSETMNDFFWNRYFVSGELNTEVKDVKTILEKAEKKYAAGKVEKIDGISAEFPGWRFNLRGSNTEPVIRLNVEAKNKSLMEEKRDELLKLVRE